MDYAVCASIFDAGIKELQHTVILCESFKLNTCYVFMFYVILRRIWQSAIFVFVFWKLVGIQVSDYSVFSWLESKGIRDISAI